MRGIAVLGGRVIDPGQGIDRHADVLIRGGRVEEVTARPGRQTPEGYEVISAASLIVAPGFIDLHCHLREPGFEHKETIATGTAAAARGGFTTVCAMANTDPCPDNASVAGDILRRIERDGAVRVLPIGAITVGRHGRQLAPMAELAEAGCVAFSDDGDPVTDPNIMRQALAYAGGLSLNAAALGPLSLSAALPGALSLSKVAQGARTGLPVINHAEDKQLSRDGQIHEGPVAARLGLGGIPAEAEVAMVARDIHLAELTGGRLHVPHISTRRAVEHVRAAKARGLHVTAEATPHHLTMTDAWVYGLHGESPDALPLTAYDANTKVSPPLRSQDDVDAVVGALADGTIDVVATDHAPHAETDKACTYEEAAKGINCLETAFGQVMSLVHMGRLKLPALLDRMSAGPARVLGLELGALKKGWPADIVLLDPDAEWAVDPQQFASKSRNTPLAGVKLKGRVVTTICAGRVAFDSRVGVR
jgi:dihydroorotase